MTQKILITGAGGEVGYTLIQELKKVKTNYVIATSLHSLPPDSEALADEFIQMDITDRKSVDKVFEKHKFDTIFHLASILSTGGEKTPELALDVNTLGSINVLEAATNQGLENKKSIIFIFPSSIAAYGLPSLEEKKKAGKVKENEYGHPITMYGITKIFTENLGVYFSKNYQMLSDIDRDSLIDFRCVRFPGLLSPDTLPSGGTSDYGSEMIHSAAQKKDYASFVRADSKIPFMAIIDAVHGIIKLSEADKKSLTQKIYNIRGFSPAASDIADKAHKLFPGTKITYDAINETRQGIVDSWPEDLNDTPAQKDWGFKAEFDFTRTFEEYLLPKIKERYGL
jgi:threonine 3-dehydrogenase